MSYYLAGIGRTQVKDNMSIRAQRRVREDLASEGRHSERTASSFIPSPTLRLCCARIDILLLTCVFFSDGSLNKSKFRD